MLRMPILQRHLPCSRGCCLCCSSSPAGQGVLSTSLTGDLGCLTPVSPPMPKYHRQAENVSGDLDANLSLGSKSEPLAVFWKSGAGVAHWSSTLPRRHLPSLLPPPASPHALVEGGTASRPAPPLLKGWEVLLAIRGSESTAPSPIPLWWLLLPASACRCGSSC